MLWSIKKRCIFVALLLFVQHCKGGALVADNQTQDTNHITALPTVPDVIKASLFANPNLLVANGKNASLIILYVKDANDNPVVNANVAMFATGSNNTLIPDQGTTDTSGIFITNITSSTAETKTVSASIDNGNLVVSQNITFVPGPIYLSTSTLTINPNTQTAGQSVSIIITLQDILGNLVSNANVSLSSSGNDNVFANASGQTVDGVFSTTFDSNIAQKKIITAVFDTNKTLQANLLITSAGNGNIATAYFVISPNTQIANGNSNVLLQLTLADIFGNPIIGTHVSFSASGYYNYIGQAVGVTNIYGVFSTTLASEYTQAKIVTATFGATSLIANVIFSAPVCNTAVFLPGLPDVFQQYGVSYTLSEDVNNDGYPDLIFDSSNAHSFMSVALGNGDGTFQTPIANTLGHYLGYSIATGQVEGIGNYSFVTSNGNQMLHVTSDGNTGFRNNQTLYTTNANAYALNGNNFPTIAVADINNDSNPDVVVLLSNANIGIFFANPYYANTFYAIQMYPLNDIPTSIALADYNNDGLIDMAVTTLNNCQLAVLLNQNNQNFSAANYIGSGYGSNSNQGYGSLIAQDVDLDGNIDIVVASSTPSVDIFYGFGNGNFASSPNRFLLNAYGYSQVAIADYNQDGISDIAVGAVNLASNTNILYGGVLVALGHGNRTFGAYTAYNTGYGASSVIAKDINHDGVVDLVVDNTFSSSITTLLGFGDGTFPTSMSFANQNYLSAPTYVAIGLLNTDSYPDIAYTDSGNVMVAFGNGNGTFANAVGYAVGLQPMCVAIADLNKDGNNDLAVVNKGSNTVSVLLGQGAGLFGAATNYAVGTSPMFVAAGYINTDAYPDLVVANSGSNKVSVLINQGASNPGIFPINNPNQYNVGTNPNVVVIADINNDGYQDLIIANSGGNTISVLLNSGTGTYPTNNPNTYLVGSKPAAIAVGHLNNDNYLDLAIANSNNQSMSVLLNNGASAPGTYPTTNPNYNYGAIYNTYPKSIAIGNILGNGNNAIAMLIGSYKVGTQASMSHVVVYAGNGNGVFPARPLYYQSNIVYPGNLVLQDINLDGTLDVLALDMGAYGQALPAIQVLLNHGCIP